MKRTILTYCLLVFTAVFVCSGVKSQEPFMNASRERIDAWTDRTMYVSGEKVFFTAVVFNRKDSLEKEFSRIFYCELITPEGKKIYGAKYLLQNSAGQGYLIIPEETISGIYFLKFYTRFMRNLSTDEYKYIMLKIINPLKTEVLKGKDAIDTTILAGHETSAQAGNQSLTFLSGKNSFLPREEIRININGTDLSGSPSKVGLSVIPGSTYEVPFFQAIKRSDTVKGSAYYPETRGISLSGRLIEKGTGKPLPGIKVNLSIIGDKDILVVRTDSSGRFFFALPDYQGNRDLFISPNQVQDVIPQILIDNDFCSRAVHLPSPIFKLNAEEMKAAYKLAVNSRLTYMFTTDSIHGVSAEDTNSVSFYGKPSDVIIIGKYIELPTLEEYFTELPMIVKLKKIQGKKQFRFYTDQYEMSIYDPLVLVDGVPVNDMNKILAMSPANIQRIELVNPDYVKGNITYGGIISFVSKKNDFAGIDLPTSGTFINYRFLEEGRDTFSSVTLAGNIPDARNTVYWNPSLPLDEKGQALISFTAPDTPGIYNILLLRLDINGGITLTKEIFVVTGK